MDDYDKYIKYKKKYLKYKKLLGGSNTYEYKNSVWIDLKNNNKDEYINYTGNYTGNIKNNNKEYNNHEINNVSIVGKKYEDDSIIGTVEYDKVPIFQNLKWLNSKWLNDKEIITDIEPMTWKDKIKNWENGIPQKYPKNIDYQFEWKTSPINKNMENQYKEKFIETENTGDQNYEKINRINAGLLLKTKIATSECLTKCIIYPIPEEGKDFKSIKNFIDNASDEQQSKFWKYVVTKINEIFNHDGVEKIYISTNYEKDDYSGNYFRLNLLITDNGYNDDEKSELF